MPRPEQLCDALGACTDVHPLYRRLLAMTLEELRPDGGAHRSNSMRRLAALLRAHQEAVQRLAAVPGLGVDSAQQIIAEVGPTATTFPTAKRLASWVGACPGRRRERHEGNHVIRHRCLQLERTRLGIADVGDDEPSHPREREDRFREVALTGFLEVEEDRHQSRADASSSRMPSRTTLRSGVNRPRISTARDVMVSITRRIFGF